MILILFLTQCLSLGQITSWLWVSEKIILHQLTYSRTHTGFTRFKYHNSQLQSQKSFEKRTVSLQVIMRALFHTAKVFIIICHGESAYMVLLLVDVFIIPSHSHITKELGKIGKLVTNFIAVKFLCVLA